MRLGDNGANVCYLYRNPLGCAVAMTALNVIQEERLAENAERLGNIFRAHMHALKAKSPLIKDVRGKGLLNAVVMDESASQQGRTAWQFCLLLKSRGVLAKPTHVNVCVLSLCVWIEGMLTTACSIRFAPPLVMTEVELEEALKRIERCVEDFDTVGVLVGFGVGCLLLSACFGSSRRFRARRRARRGSRIRSTTNRSSVWEGVGPYTGCIQCLIAYILRRSMYHLGKCHLQFRMHVRHLVGTTSTNPQKPSEKKCLVCSFSPGISSSTPDGTRRATSE